MYFWDSDVYVTMCTRTDGDGDGNGSNPGVCERTNLQATVLIFLTAVKLEHVRNAAVILKRVHCYGLARHYILLTLAHRWGIQGRSFTKTHAIKTAQLRLH